jgi:hypothetical protein
MSPRHREPEAVLGEEDYRIVKFTHDIELATQLMLAKLSETYEDGQPYRGKVGKPRQVWVRCLGALPNSYANAEGWAYAFHEEPGPRRGNFKAVVFWV